MNVAKSVPCDSCIGDGKYHGDTTCVRCNGNGRLDLKRIDHLQFNYFPRKLSAGRISKQVFEREINTLNLLREKLGAPNEDIGGSPIGTGPVLLDSVLCSKYGVTLDTTVRELKAKFPSIFIEEF